VFVVGVVSLCRAFMSTISAGSSQERDFPISRNPSEERRRVFGTNSLDPWDCFYKGGGHLAALELRGGQHKDFYVR
jgi:hypothetical protein